MFANIQWNTAALIQMTGRNRLTAAQRRATAPARHILAQVSMNTDKRLQRLSEQFESLVESHLAKLKDTQRKPESLDVADSFNDFLKQKPLEGITDANTYGQANESMRDGIKAQFDALVSEIVGTDMVHLLFCTLRDQIAAPNHDRYKYTVVLISMVRFS